VAKDLVGISCEELCLLSELANIDFTKFTAIVVGRVATEGPNLAAGLQSSQISILYSYEGLLTLISWVACNLISP